ncbi:MAG: YdcH family protein [Micavibrio sp.]|nr:YdcH family protein [Micavibrio sp.]
MSARAYTPTKGSRAEALRSRHTVISGRIEQAQKCPSTTDFLLRQLKKQKLALKEEIDGIRSRGAGSAAH